MFSFKKYDMEMKFNTWQIKTKLFLKAAMKVSLQ